MCFVLINKSLKSRLSGRGTLLYKVEGRGDFHSFGYIAVHVLDLAVHTVEKYSPIFISIFMIQKCLQTTMKRKG